MATEQEIRSYVDSLPPIYKEILAAFPRFVPNRKAGFGLAYQSIAADFENRQIGFSLGEVMLACQQLQDRGFVTIEHGIFVRPTVAGERLIEVIAGFHAENLMVPALPVPPA